jgi:cyclic beta-1,2-glucan synthetase
MGAGDWNDGMNRVGQDGQGESVWLGFFLCEVLRQFAPLARRQGDEAFAQRCDTRAASAGERLEASAWDGEWYRRAWFDDGTPLGSRDSPNARSTRSRRAGRCCPAWPATGAPARRWTRWRRGWCGREAKVVQLLDPPFDRKGPDPGYIAGYLPGVRENGGQYTHAAVWAAMAFAALGDAQRAWQVMELINPLHHGRTAGEVAVYKVEPYVVAADVYSVAPHTGRGGWSCQQRRRRLPEGASATCSSSCRRRSANACASRIEQRQLRQPRRLRPGPARQHRASTFRSIGLVR